MADNDNKRVINMYGGTYIESQTNYNSTVINGDDPKAVKDGEDDLADRLKPIFKNDAEQAKDFLHRIQGAKPTAVTALVKQLVKDGVIVEEMKYGELYKLLHDAGLYTCTPSNWNSQVKD